MKTEYERYADYNGFSETFEQYAMNHRMHQHCHECKGCILDLFAQQFSIVWCIGCRDAGKAIPSLITWKAK